MEVVRIWTVETQTSETIIYSGRDDDIHQSTGVAIIMSKKAAKCLGS